MLLCIISINYKGTKITQMDLQEKSPWVFYFLRDIVKCYFYLLDSISLALYILYILTKWSLSGLRGNTTAERHGYPLRQIKAH